MSVLRRNLPLLIAMVAIVGIIAAIQAFVPKRATPAAEVLPSTTAAVLRGEDPAGQPMPEFTNVAAWVNSKPLTMASLKGKVVLVDFWTYSCVNCLRTLPYLKEWQSKYASKGLLIVGVHSPEFEFEKDVDNVRTATAKHGITWPIAVDNEYGTWVAYGNRYWPHKYIGDANGGYRFHHIGEGNYRMTEITIRDLLTESGVDVSGIPLGSDGEHTTWAGVSPELYMGSAWAHLKQRGTDPTPEADRTRYIDKKQRFEGMSYLHGYWSEAEEYVQYVAGAPEGPGYVGILYYAKRVNFVASTAKAPAVVEVLWDGVPVPKEFAGDDLTYDANGRSIITITEPRMYNAIANSDPDEHEVRLLPRSTDFQLYTFTFSGS